MSLDLAFVLGFGWGVSGVAFATFLAEWSGLAMGLYLCRVAFQGSAWRDWARIFDRVRLKRMAVVNTDIMIRSLLLQAIFVSFLLLGGRFGAVTLAANQVLLQFMHIISFALDGFAFAAEALVGQALGARALGRLRQAAWITSLWGLGSTAMFMLGFWLFGDAIIILMTKDPEVQQAAMTYLPWIVAAPIVALASFMLDGIFIGATRTGDMRNMMALSAMVYAAAVFALMPVLGNHGLWAALMVSFVARGITLALRYPALERAALRPSVP